MKKIFLAWKPSCTRTHNQARHFGAKEILIWPIPDRGSWLFKLVRYSASFIATLRVLYREKADVIFLLNQPPFLVMAVAAYTGFFKGAYVLDSHSGAFNDPRWAWFRPIYRRLAKRALVNINTNKTHKSIVEAWGGKSVIISDVPIDHNAVYEKIDVPPKSIMVVSSFSFDEPIDEVWEAARLLPDVTFFVTGNHALAPSRLLENKPGNVKLTGYIPMHVYFQYMVSVDAVMVLTTRDDTMQRGAYEALSLEQPIVTSNWPILRESFGAAAVYVDPAAQSIAEGVKEMIQSRSKYKQAAIRQKQLRWAAFRKARDEILELLPTGPV